MKPIINSNGEKIILGQKNKKQNINIEKMTQKEKDELLLKLAKICGVI